MQKYFTYALLLSFLILNSCKTTAQKSIYGTDSKKAVKYFKKSRAAFSASQHDKTKLVDAEKFAKKAMDKDPKFMGAIMLLAEINIAKKDYEEAIRLKEKALRINPEFSKNEYYYLARMQMRLGKYTGCKRNALKFLTFKNTNPHFQNFAKQYIKNCDFAQVALKNPVNFTPKNLGKNINTYRPEYFPTFMGDGNTILYTRVIKDEKARLRGGKQEDFFTSTKDANGNWTPNRSVSSKINTFMNEGAPTISADGNHLIFTSCQGIDGYGANRTGKGSCDLFYAKKRGKRWGYPKNLGALINTPHWDSQPCFSADGRTLYFIRAIKKHRARLNPQEQDIYVTHLKDEGYWSTPKKLSNTINTPGREESVFIHPDGQTLYFASNGHTGMGGTDLFLSRLQPNGEWGKPQNLGYPINTSGNENSIVVSAKGEIAYFASDRKGGFGDLDLYSFELPKTARPIYTTYMKGKVFDSETKLPIEATFELIDLASGKVLLKSNSNSMTGDFLVNIPTDKELAINVSKSDYFFFSKNFSLKKNSKEPLLLNIPLNKIKISDKGFVLENIFFDVNKSNLKEKSKIELDKLVEFMENNKSIKIELGGHTDSDGEANKNQILSENRAKSAADYLVSKGINNSRVTYKGYGETKPKVENNSAENKAINRRTEVKIIGA